MLKEKEMSGLNNCKSYKKSFHNLRMGIGITGFLLPFVLYLGRYINTGCYEIKSSISIYYYTSMGDLFVGVLFAIGLYFILYKGYEPLPKEKLTDNLLGNITGICAIGVAIFPTANNVEEGSAVISTLHLIFAVVFFACLAIYTLVNFQRSNLEQGEKISDRKKLRNKIYVACGVVIIFCLVLMAVFVKFYENSSLKNISPIFWLESIALCTFGVAWFIKGEGILEDEKTK